MESPRLAIPDVGLTLALAVVSSAATPLVMIGGDLTVIAASNSFCVSFGVEPDAVRGQKMAMMGNGEWAVPQLGVLLKATLAGHSDIPAYEMSLARPGYPVRHLVISAQKLVYADLANARVLLTVSDMTEVRAADKLRAEMLREMATIRDDRAMLLRELQHRVANSLQIIASVLLQSARRVQSDETRSHLREAHQRVMSVAAVQRLLAESSTDDVQLRPYFTDLCASLGASMIRDHATMSLRVETDDTVTSADVSISLGLIVTELVINALKHAFPGDRPGHIVVDYHANVTDWTLSVSDDGVGMDESPARAKPGLGTSIVLALAKQLQAEVTVAGTNPGTAVSVVHADGAPGLAGAV